MYVCQQPFIVESERILATVPEEYRVLGFLRVVFDDIFYRYVWGHEVVRTLSVPCMPGYLSRSPYACLVSCSVVSESDLLENTQGGGVNSHP